jgi:hypothetical protein
MNKSARIVDRNRPAFQRAWLNRIERQQPIVLSALHLNDIALIHVPGECFVEYQLHWQRVFPTRKIAVAAYGDGGPWYIPTKNAYPQGGYEVTMAFADPCIEDHLNQGVQSLFG